MTRHIHLGLGRFHRAHQAVYLQNCDTSITAFSMRRPTEALALRAAGHTYELVTCGGGQSQTQSISAIDEALFIQDSRERFFELMEDPDITTLTLTITEKGYTVDSPTIALLKEGLQRRQARHSNPFNILSCDNLSGNGNLLKELCESSQANYDSKLVAFPNTMVDRIVPAGDSPLIIKTETFHQWVIEDSFVGLRPSWGQEGLMFVESVEPFERLKLCLLNASHTFMAYYAQLQGHEFVHQAIKDPEIRSLVEKLYFEDVGPRLDIPKPLTLESYGQALLARFNNPDLPHRLDQIAMDGSVKIPFRFLEFVEHSEVLQMGLEAWFRYMWLGLSGKESVKISDPHSEDMKALLKERYEESRQAWSEFFGWQITSILNSDNAL